MSHRNRKPKGKAAPAPASAAASKPAANDEMAKAIAAIKAAGAASAAAAAGGSSAAATAAAADAVVAAADADAQKAKAEAEAKAKAQAAAGGSVAGAAAGADKQAAGAAAGGDAEDDDGGGEGEGDEGEDEGDEDDDGEGEGEGEGDDEEDDDGADDDLTVTGRGSDSKLQQVTLNDVLVSFTSEPFVRVPDNKKFDCKVALAGKVVALYFARPLAEADDDVDEGAADAAKRLRGSPDPLPVLTKVYNELKAKRDAALAAAGGDAKAGSAAVPPEFQIVLLSADETKSDFHKTFKGMPHGTLSLPYQDNRVAVARDALGVDNPPSVALFDAQGQVLSLDGYELLAEQGSASYPWTAPSGPVRELTMLVAREWQSRPCVVLIAEGAPAAEQKRLTDVVTAAAAEHKLPVFYSFEPRIATETVRATLNDVRRNPLLCVLHLTDEHFRTKFLWTPPGAATAPAAGAASAGVVAATTAAAAPAAGASAAAAPTVPFDAFDATSSAALSAAAATSFVRDYSAGTLTPVLKSAPRPANDRDPVNTQSSLCCVVADSFEELVAHSKRPVLLLSDMPWELPCRQLESHLDTVNRILHTLWAQQQHPATGAATVAAGAAAAGAGASTSAAQPQPQQPVFNTLPYVLVGKIHSRDNELDPAYLGDDDELLLKLLLPAAAGQKKKTGVVFREESFTAGTILAWLHKHLPGPASFDLKAALVELGAVRKQQVTAQRAGFLRAFDVVAECKQQLTLDVCFHVFETLGLSSSDLSAWKKRLTTSLRVKPRQALTADQWLSVWSEFCAREDVNASDALTMTLVSAVVPCAVDGSPACCSYSVTGQTHVVQEFFLCDTCGTDGGLGCCGACRRVCHKGHRLRRHPAGDVEAYCDCGAGGYGKRKPCKALRVFDCDKRAAAAAATAAAAAPTAAAPAAGAAAAAPVSAVAAAADDGVSAATKALGNLNL